MNDFLYAKEHMTRNSAATAAVGGVQVPIRGANIVARRETECAGDAVDQGRRGFDLEEDAYGGFVEVEMSGREAKAGAEFFVAEAGTEADGAKWSRPAGFGRASAGGTIRRPSN